MFSGAHSSRNSHKPSSVTKCLLGIGFIPNIVLNTRGTQMENSGHLDLMKLSELTQKQNLHLHLFLKFQLKNESL